MRGNTQRSALPGCVQVPVSKHVKSSGKLKLATPSVRQPNLASSPCPSVDGPDEASNDDVVPPRTTRAPDAEIAQRNITSTSRIPISARTSRTHTHTHKISHSLLQAHHLPLPTPRRETAQICPSYPTYFACPGELPPAKFICASASLVQLSLLAAESRFATLSPPALLP